MSLLLLPQSKILPVRLDPVLATPLPNGDRVNAAATFAVAAILLFVPVISFIDDQNPSPLLVRFLSSMAVL